MFNYLDEVSDKRVRGGLQEYIGEFLYKFITEQDLKLVVETGVSWGFSSCYFLEALEKTTGDLVSIEKYLMEKRARVVPDRLYSRWEIIEDSSKSALPGLFEKIGKIDLFWHDSDHSYVNQLFEYRVAKPMARFIGSHDIHRRDRCAWDTFKNEVNHRLIFEDKEFGLLEVLA